MLLLGAEDWTPVSWEHSLMRSHSAAGALIKFTLGSKQTPNGAKHKTKKLFCCVLIAEHSTFVRICDKNIWFTFHAKGEKSINTS